MLTQDLAVILNWLGFAWPKHRIQQVLSQVEMPRRSDFGSITVLSRSIVSYRIYYIYKYIYIYQSIEAWGTWSILEVSTSSTGSRMDPHSFIVCMRKVRETELEAATVCPAAVSNRSWNEIRHLETFPCQMVQDILKRHDSNNSGTIYMRQAGGKRVCFFRASCIVFVRLVDVTSYRKADSSFTSLKLQKMQISCNRWCQFWRRLVMFGAQVDLISQC